MDHRTFKYLKNSWPSDCFIKLIWHTFWSVDYWTIWTYYFDILFDQLTSELFEYLTLTYLLNSWPLNYWIKWLWHTFKTGGHKKVYQMNLTYLPNSWLLDNLAKWLWHNFWTFEQWTISGFFLKIYFNFYFTLFSLVTFTLESMEC